MGPSLLVDIGKKFRGWMGAEKYSIEERISMTRIAYSLLRMNIGKHECERPEGPVTPFFLLQSQPSTSSRPACLNSLWAHQTSFPASASAAVAEAAGMSEACPGENGRSVEKSHAPVLRKRQRQRHHPAGSAAACSPAPGAGNHGSGDSAAAGDRSPPCGRWTGS